jgi:hypothetical protein
MSSPQPAIRKRGEEALAALQELPDSKPVDIMKQRLDDAIAALVQMRNELIDARRKGENIGEWLPRTNAILSTIYGTEFPVGGLNVQRIEEARAALHDLIHG